MDIPKRFWLPTILLAHAWIWTAVDRLGPLWGFAGYMLMVPAHIAGYMLTQRALDWCYGWRRAAATAAPPAEPDLAPPAEPDLAPPAAREMLLGARANYQQTQIKNALDSLPFIGAHNALLGKKRKSTDDLLRYHINLEYLGIALKSEEAVRIGLQARRLYDAAFDAEPAALRCFAETGHLPAAAVQP